MRPFVRRYFPRLLGLSSAPASNDDYIPRRHHPRPLDPFPRRSHPHFAGARHRYSTALELGRDNGSGEHILLPSAQGKGMDGIVHTIEFDVDNSTLRD